MRDRAFYTAVPTATSSPVWPVGPLESRNSGPVPSASNDSSGIGYQPPLLLTVNGFADGEEVPIKYSCSGQPGVSPAMEWKQAPPGTLNSKVRAKDAWLNVFIT